MNLVQFFTLNFYFSDEGLEVFPSLIVGLVFGASLVLLGMIWLFYRRWILKSNLIKKLTSKYAGRLIYAGLLALLLVWFRIENLYQKYRR